MKKIFVIACCLLIAIASCKKDKVVSKVVKVSFPTFTLKGEKYVSIPVGGSYSDPGATVFDDVDGSTKEIMATSSTLDVNTPGLYYMLYTAKNANTYQASVARYIAVTDYADAIDLSGVYKRVSNGVEVNLTRVAKGMYKTDDMGGAGINDAGYFTVIDANTIDFGPQYSETIGAEISGSDAAITIVDENTVTYQYVLDAPGYGTALRVFEKQ